MSLDMKRLIVDRLKDIGSLEYTKIVLEILYKALAVNFHALESHSSIKN
jgi:hypothetical protein